MAVLVDEHGNMLAGEVPYKITEVSFSRTTTAQGYAGVTVPESALLVDIFVDEGYWILRTARDSNNVYFTVGTYNGTISANTDITGKVRYITNA